MPQYYYNKNHAQHDQMRSGPYVFRNGLIKTDDANDSTVGPILVTFYGCRKVSDVEALAVLEKYNSSALETEGELIKAQIAADKAKAEDDAKKAKVAADEDSAKAEALKAEAAKAKAEADAKAKAEAGAKAKAEAGAKPEDKM